MIDVISPWKPYVLERRITLFCLQQRDWHSDFQLWRRGGKMDVGEVMNRTRAENAVDTIESHFAKAIANLQVRFLQFAWILFPQRPRNQSNEGNLCDRRYVVLFKQFVERALASELDATYPKHVRPWAIPWLRFAVPFYSEVSSMSIPYSVFATSSSLLMNGLMQPDFVADKSL